MWISRARQKHHAVAEEMTSGLIFFVLFLEILSKSIFITAISSNLP